MKVFGPTEINYDSIWSVVLEVGGTVGVGEPLVGVGAASTLDFGIVQSAGGA